MAKIESSILSEPTSFLTLRRMISLLLTFKRNELLLPFKKQKSGCLAAWYAKSSDGEPLLLVQSIFASRQDWIDISNAIIETLDSRDGGLDSCLLGPPLVGVFTIETDDLQLNLEQSE